MISKILQALKPKATSLGFSETELKSVAETISLNLQSKDDVTEDDINAQIDAVLPILKVGQQAANRLVTKLKNETPKPQPEPQPKPEGEDTAPAWAQKMIEQMSERIARLEQDKTSASRLDRLTTILKDSGSFGAQALKNFKRITFGSEDEFAAYLEETKTDLETFRKEMSEQGLNITPLATQNIGKSAEATNEEADAVADNF